MSFRKISFAVFSFAAALSAYLWFFDTDTVNQNKISCVKHKPNAISACSSLLNRADLSMPERLLYLKARTELHFGVGDTGNALADIETTLVLDPKNIVGLQRRATINSRLGFIDKFAADYETAIALNPDRVVTYMDRAATLVRMGRYELALNDYQTVLRIEPQNQQAFLKATDVYRKKKENLVVIQRLKQAAKIWPGDEFILSTLGLFFLTKSDEPAQAFEFLSEVETLFPDNPIHMFYLGFYHLYHGQENVGKNYIYNYVEILHDQQNSDPENFSRNIKLKTKALFDEMVTNRSSRLAYRNGIAFSMIDRTDLAIIEFKRFQESGGKHARDFLTNTLVEKEFWRPASNTLDDALLKFSKSYSKKAAWDRMSVAPS